MASQRRLAADFALKRARSYDGGLLESHPELLLSNWPGAAALTLGRPADSCREVGAPDLTKLNLKPSIVCDILPSHWMVWGW